MPAGNFVLVFIGHRAQNVVLRTRRIPSEGETPTLNDIVDDVMRVRFAFRIVFVGDDGAVWLMKDKWSTRRLPTLLRKPMAKPDPKYLRNS